MRWCLMRDLSRVLRRIVAAIKRWSDSSSIGRAGECRGNRLCSRSRPTRHIKRCRITLAVRGRSCTVEFSGRGVPLPPVRTFAAWPIDWSFPLINRRRSWGSLTLRRFDPAAGWRFFSASPGPRAVWHPLDPARLIFVGPDSSARMVRGE